jgi:hypothetical protein
MESTVGGEAIKNTGYSRWQVFVTDAQAIHIAEGHIDRAPAFAHFRGCCAERAHGMCWILEPARCSQRLFAAPRLAEPVTVRAAHPVNPA